MASSYQFELWLYTRKFHTVPARERKGHKQCETRVTLVCMRCWREEHKQNICPYLSARNLWSHLNYMAFCVYSRRWRMSLILVGI